MRPIRVCYCRHITSLTTTTRVVLLQHPRERDVAIGTARMAHLSLPNSELHVGVHWDDSEPLRRALSDPSRPPILLYPGDGARDLETSPPAGPVTLVVVDGTWWQTKKVVRESRVLRDLPRYAFVPHVPSEYRIRREPRASYVSTIEALAHVLGALEGTRPRFEPLMAPFRAMIDAQIACENTHRATRVRTRARRAGQPRHHAPPWLAERHSDLVCVVGEANAWPYDARAKKARYPDELVQWAAVRIATGEAFECVIRPAHPLAPHVTSQVGLGSDELAAGVSVASFEAAWRAFLRPTDRVCTWGPYAMSLLPSALLASCDTVDLRPIARQHARGRVGTLDEVVARHALTPGPPIARGRAGLRVGQIAAITRALVECARGS
jgi:DTW domain-containing protein YfiP